MNGRNFKKTKATSVPTPTAGDVVLFIDESTNHLMVKDEVGTLWTVGSDQTFTLFKPKSPKKSRFTWAIINDGTLPWVLFHIFFFICIIGLLVYFVY